MKAVCAALVKNGPLALLRSRGKWTLKPMMITMTTICGDERDQSHVTADKDIH